MSINNAIFSGVYGQGASFIDAELINSEWQGGRLYGALFENAKLKNAELMGAIVKYSNFTGADFTNSDLTLVDFEGANISKANFTNTKGLDNDMLIRNAWAWEDMLPVPINNPILNGIQIYRKKCRDT